MSELPKGWVLTPLGGVATVRSGIGFPLNFQGSIVGDLDFYKVGDISRAVAFFDGQLREPQHRVTFEVADKLKGTPIFKGATVFAKIGEAIHLNRRAMVVEDCLVDNNVMAVKALPTISDKLLFRFMQSQDLSELARSTTVPSIRKGDVESLMIPLAPLSEQTRIANQLDTLLTRIQSCNHRFDAIPALLKRFRQTVTNSACSGELSAEWRGTSDLKGWKSQALAHVCNSITDGDHQAPPQADSGVPFITISAMNDGRLRLEKASRFVPQSYFDRLKPSRRPARGDLLFSVTGSIGIPAQVDTDEPFTFQRHIAILKPNKSLILSSFIALALGSEAMRTQVMGVATGTAQLTIPLSGIRGFVLNLPQIDEQTEIVRRVEALFALADRIKARATVARSHAQRLSPLVLAKAFRGELVPQDPQDEPASVLLERIATQRAMPAEKKPSAKSRQVRTPRELKEASAMTKSRQDDDVKNMPYLADHLRRLGSATTAEVLFKAAELPVADFYKQLAWEVAQGHIADSGTTLEAHHAVG